MPRQRIINPEFWLDYEIASIENPNACLFYIGTWNFSDDYGVIENNPHKLKAQIFPYREVDVSELIDIFVKIGKFIPFKASGKNWLYVKNFLTFQKIKKPSKFRNPEYRPEPVGKEYGTSGEPVVSETKAVTKTKENNAASAAVPPDLSLNAEPESPQTTPPPPLFDSRAYLDKVESEDKREHVKLIATCAIEMGRKFPSEKAVSGFIARNSRVAMEMKEYPIDTIFRAIDDIKADRFYDNINWGLETILKKIAK
jgi:hypothetical protein